MAKERKLELLIKRNEQNSKSLNALTLEDCVIMHDVGGTEIICGDGKVQEIYD